jgi:hypothetical protein
LGRVIGIGIWSLLLVACGGDDDGGQGVISLCDSGRSCSDLGALPDSGEVDAGPALIDGAMDSSEADAAAHSDMNALPDCSAMPPTCAPDGRTRILCNPDNGRPERVACADAEYCLEGACEAHVCVPEMSVCEGQIARLCDALGQGFLDGADEDCEALGQTCEDGRCADSIESSRGATCEDIECMAERPASLICGRFATDILETTANPFNRGPSGQCDPGTLTEDAYDEALRVANYARWLTGLPEVDYDDGLNPRTQACATIMANQRALSHDPPRHWACWTQEGADAAGESNIHLNSRSETIVDSVIGYLRDGGDNNRADVGHRRWLQSPTLGRVGFGYHHSQSTNASASCYNVISSAAARRSGPPFVAYPNPGVFPLELVTSRFWTLPWSVSIHSGYRDPWADTGQWSVSVWRISGEEMTPLDVQYVNASGQWYGRNHAVVFSPNFEVTEGTYRILVEGPEHRFEWTTELVRCGG